MSEFNIDDLPIEHQVVLGECIAEAVVNHEAGDVHTCEDIAADIAQRLYRIWRVAPHDDGEPGPLRKEQ